MSTDKAIQISSLSFSYEKNRPVLENISFDIRKGDFMGIVGPNGSGKTTLMRIILGLESKYDGKVEIMGKSQKKFNSWNKVGYVPQKYEREQHFPATVKEILNLEKEPKEPELPKKEILTMLEIHDFEEDKFIELSGGQQQRVMVALALIKNPEILILDEPSVGVDIKTQEEFYNTLNKLNEEHNLTIILISHDIGMVSEHTDKVMLLNRSVCCTGKTEELPELLQVAYDDEFKVFQHLGGHSH